MPVGIEPLNQEEKMKKFLVVLLSLGLIAAFAATASAAPTVTFGGSYYVAGAYDNNPMLVPDGSASQAFVFQQVRIKPVFQIAEGLTFTLRFDAIEKQWGDMRWVNANYGAGTTNVGNPTATSDKNGTRASTGVAGVATAENVDFEQAFVTFTTGLGTFQVGYQDANAWGTNFGNSPGTLPGVLFTRKFGDFTLGVQWEHAVDRLTSTSYPTVATNSLLANMDSDTYALMGVYKSGPVEGGLLYKWYLDDTNKNAAAGYRSSRFLVQPYAKLSFGNFYFETELSYMYGKSRQFEDNATPGSIDKDEQSWSAYFNGNYKVGPATVGGLFAIVSGNDYATDKSKGDLNCGYAWNPALILMNGDLKWWGGSGHYPNQINRRTEISAANMNAGDDVKSNTVWYNIYANYAATPKLMFNTALTYATVQTKKTSATTEADSDRLGTEFDLTATYKIFDNLTYMVGAGYLWTGDYYKAVLGTTSVGNNYLLMNKLTLSF